MHWNSLFEGRMMRASRRGTLLVLSIVMVVIVSGMVTTMLVLATSRTNHEDEITRKTHSLQIAEAAVDIALSQVRLATDGVDNDGDGVIDEFAQAAVVSELVTPIGHLPQGDISQMEGQLGRLGTVNWTSSGDTNGNGLPDFGEPGVTPLAFSGGQVIAYTVLSELDGLDNDGDGTTDEADESGFIYIVARGVWDGRESTVTYSGRFTQEMSVPNPPLWIPNVAIAANSDMIISGTCDIQGAGGNVHANGTVTINGQPATVSGDVTATGGVAGNTSNVGGTVDGAAPHADVPNIDPKSLKSQADAIFDKNGNVYDQAGNLLASGSYQGWSFSVDGSTGEKMWTLSGNPTFNGTAYMETNAKLTGIGAKVVQPMPISIISEENLLISGNGSYRPYLANSELLFVAGGDIKLTGSAKSGDQAFQGIIAAREQIFQTGNSDVNGVLVSSNLDDTHTLVTDTRITGTAQVTYDGNINPSFPIVYPSHRYIIDPSIVAYEER